jgi:hypothetical protein
MSQVQRTVNHCDICNHEWIPTPGVVYTHCTSGKCRSRKWNAKVAAGDPNDSGGLARMPKPPARPFLKPEMRKSIETLTGCVRRLASKETVAWIERETTTGYVSPIRAGYYIDRGVIDHQEERERLINPTGKPCKSCGALGGNHFRGCKQ